MKTQTKCYIHLTAEELKRRAPLQPLTGVDKMLKFYEGKIPIERGKVIYAMHTLYDAKMDKVLNRFSYTYALDRGSFWPGFFDELGLINLRKKSKDERNKEAVQFHQALKQMLYRRYTHAEIVVPGLEVSTSYADDLFCSDVEPIEDAEERKTIESFLRRQGLRGNIEFWE